MNGNQISALESYHGIKFTTEQHQNYLWFFDTYKDIGDQIVNRWKFKASPRDRFPSLADLTNVATEIRQAAWQKQKQKSAGLDDLKHTHKREACQLIYAILDGKLTQEQYPERFTEMDAKYPGLGWAEAVSKIFNEKGGPLKSD